MWQLFSTALQLVTKCTLGTDRPVGAGCPHLCCRESLCFQGCPASSWDRILWALKVSLLSWQEHRQATSPYSGAFPWTRKSNLDYLALDFNSASPSPVQKVWVPCEEPQTSSLCICWEEDKIQSLLGALGMYSSEGLWASLVLAGSLHALPFSLCLHKPFPASFPPNLFAVTNLQPIIYSLGKTVLSLVTQQNLILASPKTF